MATASASRRNKERGDAPYTTTTAPATWSSSSWLSRWLVRPPGLALALAVGVAVAERVWRWWAKRWSLVFLSHIHKTGGSSLCLAAEQQRLRVPPQYADWGNCNFACAWYDALHSGSDEMSELASLDFVANEGPLVPLRAPRSLRVLHLIVARSADPRLKPWKSRSTR